MTTAADLLSSELATYQRCGDQLIAAVGELDAAHWFDQPAGHVNHAAWTTAHLCVTGARSVVYLGGIDPIDDDWRGRFAGGTLPLAAPDEGHADIATILARYRHIHTAVAEAAAQCPAARLDEANPLERARAFQPTLGGMVKFMITAHEAYHVGQLKLWAKAVAAGR